MGVTIGIVIGIVMVILSFLFRDDLGVLRNLVLIWGTPLAILLALWRSMVAERQVKVAQKQAETALRQAEIAQRGLASNQYQRAVEMLDNDIASIRLGGIYTLYKIVREHPDEYLAEVARLLDAYKGNPHLGRKRSEIDELEGIILSIRRLDEELHS